MGSWRMEMMPTYRKVRRACVLALATILATVVAVFIASLIGYVSGAAYELLFHGHMDLGLADMWRQIAALYVGCSVLFCGAVASLMDARK